MDPPDPDPDAGRAWLYVSFQWVLASQAPYKPPPVDARFVKRVEAPKVKLSSLASKFKAVALHERGLVDHFIGLWPFPRSIETWLNKN